MRLILAFLIFVQSAHGAVLIQGPGTPALDYRAALKADPDLLSPTAQMIKSRPLTEAREKLLLVFTSAQKSFLENSLSEAQIYFQNVVALMNTADWTRTDRQIFLHSYLRLAQMQTEMGKQDTWLALAVAAGDDTEPEAGLFPPPLLKRLMKFRSEIPRAVVPAQLFSDGWTTVLLNGVACTAQNCTGVPMGGQKIRATFLSDVWQSVTLNLEASDLRTVQPKRSAWITGDCAKTQFSAASQSLRDPQTFWGLGCETPPAKALNFNPVARTEVLPRIEIKEKSPAFYKSKWFWGSVAAVAVTAAIVLANGQKKKEEREPTTTYGYQ